MTSLVKEKGWYEVRGESTSNLELYIYGTIGEYEEYCAGNLINYIENVVSMEVIDTLTVHINSRGGDFYESLAIHSYLSALDKKVKVTTYVDALAASGASLIAMAGSTIIMAEGSFMMLHNPKVSANVDYREVAKLASVAEQFRDSCVSIYASRTGCDKEKVASMMDEVTWIGAEQALELGFCDAIDSSIEYKAAACAGAEDLPKVPEELLNREVEFTVGSEMEEVEAAKAAALEADKAKETEEAEAAKLVAAKEQASAEIAEIISLCKLARRLDLIEGFVTDNTSVEDAKKVLLSVVAACESSADIIDSKARVETEKKSQYTLDIDGIYKKWNSTSVNRTGAGAFNAESAFKQRRAAQKK